MVLVPACAAPPLATTDGAIVGSTSSTSAGMSAGPGASSGGEATSAPTTGGVSATMSKSASSTGGVGSSSVASAGTCSDPASAYNLASGLTYVVSSRPTSSGTSDSS